MILRSQVSNERPGAPHFSSWRSGWFRHLPSYGYAVRGAVSWHPIPREPLSARMVVRVGPRADELQGERRLNSMLREVVECASHFH
jgi:hypothetical protein